MTITINALRSVANKNTRFALVNKYGDTKKNCCQQINAKTIPVLLIPVKHLKKGHYSAENNLEGDKEYVFRLKYSDTVTSS